MGLYDASLNGPTHLICPACLVGPARLIGPAHLTILKKKSLPARLTEPARLTIFRKKSTRPCSIRDHSSNRVLRVSEQALIRANRVEKTLKMIKTTCSSIRDQWHSKNIFMIVFPFLLDKARQKRLLLEAISRL